MHAAPFRLAVSHLARRGAILTVAPVALAVAGAVALGLTLAAPRSAAAAGASEGQPAAAVDVPKAALGAYDIDTAHSTVGFRIKHLDVAYQFGRFDKFSGEVVLGATPDASSVKVVIDAASVNSANEARDQHLRNQDFLDVKQFAEATFQSKRVAAKDADTFTVSGDLTLHGVTKPVTFDMDFLGAKDAGERFGFKAGFFGTLDIQRRDFGIDTYPNEVLSDTIQLTLAIECNKRK